MEPQINAAKIKNKISRRWTPTNADYNNTTDSKVSR